MFDITACIIEKIKEIFVIYILIQLHLDIINEDDAIIFFYKFTEKKYNLIINSQQFNSIIEYLKLTKFDKLIKYITFIFVISILEEESDKIINYCNKSNLYKVNKKKIEIYEETNNSNIINKYNNINNEIDYIKNYLLSFEFNKKKGIFLSGIYCANSLDIKNINKNELIDRIKLLYLQLGKSFVFFIANKKDRKNPNSYFDILEESYLEEMQYEELVKYCIIFFDKINKNLENMKKDFEFCKYLKIIYLNFVETKTDKITDKLYKKLLKKYNYK